MLYYCPRVDSGQESGRIRQESGRNSAGIISKNISFCLRRIYLNKNVIIIYIVSFEFFILMTSPIIKKNKSDLLFLSPAVARVNLVMFYLEKFIASKLKIPSKTFSKACLIYFEKYL
jgi:hypothetical protein